MILVKDDNVIEQLTTDRADESLGSSVLPRAAESRSFRADIEAVNRVRDGSREDRVVVVDDESMARLFREGLAQLLDHPARVGVLGDVKVQNLPASVVDRESNVSES